MVELLRSPTFYLDTGYEATQPFTKGALFQLDGKEHVARRRVLNKLAQPAALGWHRDEVLVPLVRSTLAEMSKHPDDDGVYRADLPQLVRTLFTSFAGALIGAERALTPEGSRQLFHIFERNEAGFRVKFVYDEAERRRIIDEALAARAEFERDFFEPGLQQARERLAQVEAGELAESDLPPTLIGLIASVAHPDYADRTTAVNECLMLLLGAVDTSSNLIVQELDLLWDWLELYPDERSRLTDRRFLLKVSQETLRLHSAFETMTRWAKEDFTFPSGKTVKAGRPAYGTYIGANSDPAVWGEGLLSFNPDREIPQAVPHYGTSFGGGVRQCLGLRIVLGEKDTAEGASHLDVLRLFLEAGIRPDPERPMELRPDETGHPQSYPVVFTNLAPFASLVEV
jgi:cytochrome P450